MYNASMARIDIQRNDAQQVVFFPLPRVSSFFDESDKEFIQHKCNRESTSNKLRDFLGISVGILKVRRFCKNFLACGLSALEESFLPRGMTSGVRIGCCQPSV